MVIYNVQLFFKRLSDQHNFFHMKNCVELYWFLYVWRADYMYLSFPFSLILLWLFQESVSFWNRNKLNIVKKSRIDHFVSKQCKIFFLMCQFSQLITHEKVNIMNSWMAKTSFFLVNKDVYLPYTHLYFPLHLIHQDMIF